MRPLVIVCLLGASACWNFERDFNDRCGSGGYSSGTACGATGGGEGTGGGTATGGGTETGGGTATGRPVTLDSSLTTPANCTTSGWCWQHPTPIGAADLWTVFGTSDSDVWVGGSASTLLHWDGSAWGRLPLSPAPSELTQDPAIIGAVTTSSLVVLVRDGAPALVSDGGEFTNSGKPMRVAVADGDEVVFIDDRKRLQRLGHPTQNGPMLSGDEFRSLAWAGDAGFVVARNSTTRHTQVLNASTGDVDFDANLDGGSETLWSLFVQVDGGLGVTGGHANMFLRRGPRDWEEVSLPGFENVSAAGPLYATTRVDDSVWAVGELGAVVDLSSQQAVRRADFDQANLTSAWFSGTRVWAAGRGGATLSIDRLGETDGGRPSEFPVVDLWADPLTQVAVLENDLLVSSDGGAWVRKANANHRWVAGLGIGAIMWLLDEHGDVYTWELARTAPQFRFQLVDAGVAQNHDRNGGFTRLGDGGLVVAAQGSVASINLVDAGLAERLAEPTLPNGPSHIAGVTSSGDRLFVAGNALDGGSGLYELNGTGWRQHVFATDQIEGMARCPQGTILLAGQHEFLTSWDLNTENSLWTPTVGTTLVFSSVWCDSRNQAWVLAKNGRVAHRVGASWVFESVGWEPRFEGDRHPTLITGTASTAFVVGGNAAIVSRPLP